MEFSGEGIVLGLKKFNSNTRIASILTGTRGRWNGALPGQVRVNIGDIVDFSWKSKNPDGLGSFFITNCNSNFANNIADETNLLIIKSVCELCLCGLPEREPDDALFSFLKNNIGNPTIVWYIFFELMFLQSLGYPIDLSECSVTHQANCAYYLSPKTGRSVCKEVGEKYKDKLFLIPKFLLDSSVTPNKDELLYALEAIGYFLRKNVLRHSNEMFFRDKVIERVKYGR